MNLSKKIEKAKMIYQSIETPIELNQIVNSAIDTAVNRKHKSHVWFKPVICIAASICILFVVMLNSNQTFAESMYDIPVIGNVARVFTFREYSKSDEAYNINIKAPAIEGTGYTDLEKRINQEIQSKIDTIVKNAEERAEENRQRIIDEGRTEEDLGYFIVEIDYEIKSSNESILSFVINHMESFANTYTYQTFYNINLDTGKEITLADILGENYREIVTQSIKEQIKERTEKDNQLMYYDSDEDIEFILDYLKFYINSIGHVVISFKKGEIAPPPMGIQEFEITR